MEKVRCRVGLVFSDASSLPGESGGGDIMWSYESQSATSDPGSCMFKLLFVLIG